MRFQQFKLDPTYFATKGLSLDTKTVIGMATANSDIFKHAKRVPNVSFDE